MNTHFYIPSSVELHPHFRDDAKTGQRQYSNCTFSVYITPASGKQLIRLHGVHLTKAILPYFINNDVAFIDTETIDWSGDLARALPETAGIIVMGIKTKAGVEIEGIPPEFKTVARNYFLTGVGLLAIQLALLITGHWLVLAGVLAALGVQRLSAAADVPRHGRFDL